MRIEERQLDRIADLLDLTLEAADVFIVDIGYLFEHQLLRFRLRQLLDHAT